jgi:hypothetical protein
VIGTYCDCILSFKELTSSTLNTDADSMTLKFPISFNRKVTEGLLYLQEKLNFS